MNVRTILQWLALITLIATSMLAPVNVAHAQEQLFLPVIMRSGESCNIANLLTDGSFETGAPPWTQITGGYPIVQEDADALDGVKLAWFGGYNNANDRLVSQPFQVPPACKALRIVLHLNISSQEVGNEPYDYLYASLQPAGDVVNPEIVVADNTDDCNTCKWARYTYVYNEVPNRGQPLQLRFYGKTDSNRHTNFLVDLVSIEASDTPFTVAAEAGWQREVIVAPEAALENVRSR